MTDTNIREKELLAKQKTKVTTPAEQTRAGLAFSPAVDIFETEREISLIADMPGVNANNLTIDLREGILTLHGEVKPEKRPGEQSVYQEYPVGSYFRQFSLSEAIDQNKIDAKLKNGVLQLSLPKAQKAVPRKITVKTG